LLNILFSSHRLRPVVVRLLREHRYLSVVLKLCLHHSNTDHYADVAISVQAVKLLTAMIKSKHCSLDGAGEEADDGMGVGVGDGDGTGNYAQSRDDRGTLDLTALLLTASHKVPDRVDRGDSRLSGHHNVGHDRSDNENRSQFSNASVSSIELSGLDRNEQFVAELRTMNFVQSVCDALFGHTESNGNGIMKQICFSGHIEDYSVLSLAQKHTMYLIECLDLICRDCTAFKRAFAALINLPDISYFLCPAKQQSSGEPNQIFLSLINLIASLSDQIVGVSYLIKSRLCESKLVSVISRSLNSRAHSKDIGNAVHFMHSIFKLLAKKEELPADHSYLCTLIHGASTAAEPSVKRRNRRKQKPRHYGRGGLALRENGRSDGDAVSVHSNVTAMTGRTESSSFFDGLNVQEMAPKLLYQLFCKKMLRYNKTHRPDRAQMERTEKQLEGLRLRYSKTVGDMERTLRAKEEENDAMKLELESTRSALSEKSDALRSLRREFNELRARCMELEDESQTKKAIIRDKAEKLERARSEQHALQREGAEERRRWQQELDRMQREMEGARSVNEEVMGKLKCVCAGYQRLKEESDEKIEEMRVENAQRRKEVEDRFKSAAQELEGARQRERVLEDSLQQKEAERAQLTARLDCMMERNSKLNHKYKQSNVEIEELNQKLAETQKLAAMISGLMSASKT